MADEDSMIKALFPDEFFDVIADVISKDIANRNRQVATENEPQRGEEVKPGSNAGANSAKTGKLEQRSSAVMEYLSEQISVSDGLDEDNRRVANGIWRTFCEEACQRYDRAKKSGNAGDESGEVASQSSAPLEALPDLDFIVATASGYYAERIAPLPGKSRDEQKEEAEPGTSRGTKDARSGQMVSESSYAVERSNEHYSVAGSFGGLSRQLANLIWEKLWEKTLDEEEVNSGMRCGATEGRTGQLQPQTLAECLRAQNSMAGVLDELSQYLADVIWSSILGEACEQDEVVRTATSVEALDANDAELHPRSSILAERPFLQPSVLALVSQIPRKLPGLLYTLIFRNTTDPDQEPKPGTSVRTYAATDELPAGSSALPAPLAPSGEVGALSHQPSIEYEAWQWTPSPRAAADALFRYFTANYSVFEIMDKLQQYLEALFKVMEKLEGGQKEEAHSSWKRAGVDKFLISVLITILENTGEQWKDFVDRTQQLLIEDIGELVFFTQSQVEGGDAQTREDGIVRLRKWLKKKAFVLPQLSPASGGATGSSDGNMESHPPSLLVAEDLKTTMSALLVDTENIVPEALELAGKEAEENPLNKIFSGRRQIAQKLIRDMENQLEVIRRLAKPLKENGHPEDPEDFIRDMQELIKAFAFACYWCRNAGKCLYYIMPAHQPEDQLEVLMLNTFYEHYFKENKMLGKGAFGEVFEVQRKWCGSKTAVKKVVVDSEEAQSLTMAKKEALRLADLSHDNVVKYFYSWIQQTQATGLSDVGALTLTTPRNQDSKSDPSGTKEGRMLLIPQVVPRLSDSLVCEGLSSDSSDSPGVRDSEQDVLPGVLRLSLESEDSASDTAIIVEYRPFLILHIEMELCSTNLKNYLAVRNQALTECKKPDDKTVQESLQIFRQIMEAVKYVHSRGIAHQDIQTHNIFFGFDGTPKLGDFGLPSLRSMWQSRHSGASSRGSSSSASDSELATHNDYVLHCMKEDIYDLGLILIDLLIPFHTEKRRMEEIRKLDYPRMPFALKAYPKSVRDLVFSMRNEDENERPTAQEILDNPLFSKGKERTDEEATKQQGLLPGGAESHLPCRNWCPR